MELVARLRGWTYPQERGANPLNDLLHEAANVIAAQRKQIAELERDVAVWRGAENDLGAAYLRLRHIIPGALDTGITGPSGEQVWAHTESRAQAQRQAFDALRALCDEADGHASALGVRASDGGALIATHTIRAILNQVAPQAGGRT